MYIYIYNVCIYIYIMCTYINVFATAMSTHRCDMPPYKGTLRCTRGALGHALALWVRSNITPSQIHGKCDRLKSKLLICGFTPSEKY